MQDKFLEIVRSGFISRIEEIISETKLVSEKNNLNAIDTLILVNRNIGSWISSINGMFHTDEELLTKVAELKRPFVSAAKKEVAREVANIIENESTDVTKKINDYMNGLKKKGIDLDGDSKKKEKETMPTTECQTNSIPVERSTYDSDSSFEFNKQRILGRDFEIPRRSIFDMSSDSCGGSSGCD